VVSACRKAGVNFSLILQSDPSCKPLSTPSARQSGYRCVTPARSTTNTSNGGSPPPRSRKPLHGVESTTHKVTARLVVRRVRELNPAPPGQDELFPVRRYHAFLTDTDLPTTDADQTHRGHAIIEQLFADLIDGPLAHMPSGRFAANAAWLSLAAMAHNLIRATGCLTGPWHAKARTATIRRHLINVPARIAHRARRILSPPASPLALARALAGPVQQDAPPATTGLTLPTPPTRARHDHKEKAGTTGRPSTPTQIVHPQTTMTDPTRFNHQFDRCIQAKLSSLGCNG
jgi:hypothetical protein